MLGSFIICPSSLLFMHEKVISFHMLIPYVSKLYHSLLIFKKLVYHLLSWLYWGHYFICCKRRYSVTSPYQCLGFWLSQMWCLFKCISGTWCLSLPSVSLFPSYCCSSTASSMGLACQVPADIAIGPKTLTWPEQPLLPSPHCADPSPHGGLHSSGWWEGSLLYI